MKLNRENKLLIGLCTAAAILIAKIFSIQILDQTYKLDANNNSMVYSTIYPTRGIINDRNGKILVGNKVAYDLLVTPKEVEEFDTTSLAKVLGAEGLDYRLPVITKLILQKREHLTLACSHTSGYPDHITHDYPHLVSYQLFPDWISISKGTAI